MSPVLLRGMVGRVDSLAPVGDDLHVFYSEGSHRRYHHSKRGVRGHTELPLPGAGRPLKLSGSQEDRSVYAVVTTTLAQQVLESQEPTATTDATTGNANDNNDTPGLVDPDAGRLSGRRAVGRPRCH